MSVAGEENVECGGRRGVDPQSWILWRSRALVLGQKCPGGQSIILAALVARVKGVPTVAQINFNPCGKIHRRLGRREADVSDVTGTIAQSLGVGVGRSGFRTPFSRVADAVGTRTSAGQLAAINN